MFMSQFTISKIQIKLIKHSNYRVLVIIDLAILSITLCPSPQTVVGMHLFYICIPSCLVNMRDEIMLLSLLPFSSMLLIFFFSIVISLLPFFLTNRHYLWMFYTKSSVWMKEWFVWEGLFWILPFLIDKCCIIPVHKSWC